jgi:hypothetical protein
MVDNIIDLAQECIDEALAFMVVGGYMVGQFMGVEIPIELPVGVLAYYFVRKQQ